MLAGFLYLVAAWMFYISMEVVIARPPVPEKKSRKMAILMVGAVVFCIWLIIDVKLYETSWYVPLALMPISGLAVSAVDLWRGSWWHSRKEAKAKKALVDVKK